MTEKLNEAARLYIHMSELGQELCSKPEFENYDINVVFSPKSDERKIKVDASPALVAHLDTGKEYVNESEKEIHPLEQASIHMRLNEENKALYLVSQNSESIHGWKNKYGNTIANIAAWNGCVEVLKHLQQCGYKFQKDTISVMGARHLNVLKFLSVQKILSPNAQGDHGTTPLQQACNISGEYGIKFQEDLVPECLERINYLISLGADVNQRNADGRTAIMGAAYIGAYPLVELLIDLGADCSPNMRCNQNKSVIDYAYDEHTKSLIRNSLMASN